MQAKMHKPIVHFREFIHIPIIIGLFAVLFMWFFYGWEYLFSTILSWTIGITLVATLIGTIAKIEKKK